MTARGGINPVVVPARRPGQLGRIVVTTRGCSRSRAVCTFAHRVANDDPWRLEVVRAGRNARNGVQGRCGGVTGSDAGGPAGVESGGPAGTSEEGPAGVEAGGPAGTSAGGPAGVEAGGPAGTSAGGPAGVEAGGPAGTSAGGAAGVEAGGPAGTSTGGPAGVAAGRPVDASGVGWPVPARLWSFDAADETASPLSSPLIDESVAIATIASAGAGSVELEPASFVVMLVLPEPPRVLG
jgi:hypothetical protein